MNTARVLVFGSAAVPRLWLVPASGKLGNVPKLDGAQILKASKKAALNVKKQCRGVDVDELVQRIAEAIVKFGPDNIQDLVAWGTTTGKRLALSDARRQQIATKGEHEAEIALQRKAADETERKPRRGKLRIPSDRDGIAKRARVVAERFAQIASDIESGAAISSEDAAFVDDTFASLFKDSSHRVWMDILRSIDHAARIAMPFDERYNTVRAKAALGYIAATYPDLAKRVDGESMCAAIGGWRKQWMHANARKCLEPVRRVIELATGVMPTSIELDQAWKKFPRLGKPSLPVKNDS